MSTVNQSYKMVKISGGLDTLKCIFQSKTTVNIYYLITYTITNNLCQGYIHILQKLYTTVITYKHVKLSNIHISTIWMEHKPISIWQTGYIKICIVLLKNNVISKKVL